MTDEETLRTACELVKQKLTRSIKALAKHYAVDGRLPPDIQYAVRILESRQRLWDRIYLKQYGPPALRAMAEQELNLNRDNGELIALGNKKHGVGRLNCRACDYDYDNSGPFPVAIPQSTVCPTCQKGVKHVFTMSKPPDPYQTPTQVETIESGTSQTPLRELYNGSKSVLWVKVCHCDWCHEETEVN